MNLIRRMVRALVWGLVIGGLLWILRRWLSTLVRDEQAAPAPQRSPEAVHLHRDPYCGTYVAAGIAFPLEQAGQTEYFCSAECRDRYARSMRRAVGA